MTIKDLV